MTAMTQTNGAATNGAASHEVNERVSTGLYLRVPRRSREAENYVRTRSGCGVANNYVLKECVTTSN